MKILGFINSKSPIGMYSLEDGKSIVALRLLKLQNAIRGKYSIDQIRDFRQ